MLKDRLLVYELHLMGGAYGVRPSSLLEIQRPFVAFDFDRRVAAWGRYVEGRMAAAAPGRAKQTLMALMQGEARRQVRGLGDLRAVMGAAMGPAGE